MHGWAGGLSFGGLTFFHKLRSEIIFISRKENIFLNHASVEFRKANCFASEGSGVTPDEHVRMIYRKKDVEIITKDFRGDDFVMNLGGYFFW